MSIRLQQLRALTAGFLFLAIFCLTYVAILAPASSGKRLGLRGLKRQRAIEDSEMWAQIEPAIRWLGERVDALIAPELRARINHQLGISGDFLGLLAEEAVGLGIISCLGGTVLGGVLGYLTDMGPMLAIAGGALGAILPHLHISGVSADRFKAVSRGLPQAIDLLSLSMGAGLDFPAAVRQVIEKSANADDPVVEELTLILQGLQLGRTRRHVLEDFAARVPIEAVTEFVSALVQAEVRGNPVVPVLRIQAEVSRRRRSVRAEELAARAGVMVIGPLIMIFVAILILIVTPMALQIRQSGW